MEGTTSNAPGEPTSVPMAPEDHPLSHEARMVNAICKVNTELFKMAKALESTSAWMRNALEHFNRATEAMKQVSETITQDAE